MVKALHVGNLPYDATEDALRALFGACGEVTGIVLVTGVHRGRPLGSAFVSMKDEEARACAIRQLDGAVLDERPLHLEAVEPDDAAHEAALAAPRRARALHRARGFVRFARDAVGASAASMFLSGDAGGELRGAVGELGSSRSSLSPAGQWPAVALALATGEIRRISVTDAASPESSWFVPGRIASTLCVPLVDDAGPIGVLFFDFGAPGRALGDPDLAFLVDVGARCARALRRNGQATAATG